MIALHPPLSGMPLAFIALLMCIELVNCCMSKRESLLGIRRILIVSIIVSTAAAFFSGYQASSPLGDLRPDVQGALEEHHAYGRMLLINSILMGTFYWIGGRAVHGKKIISSLYLIALVVQLLGTLWVGHLGGALVFERGLGVRVQ